MRSSICVPDFSFTLFPLLLMTVNALIGT